MGAVGGQARGQHSACGDGQTGSVAVVWALRQSRYHRLADEACSRRKLIYAVGVVTRGGPERLGSRAARVGPGRCVHAGGRDVRGCV